MREKFLWAILFAGCGTSSPSPVAKTELPIESAEKSSLVVSNQSSQETVVHVIFGSNSKVLPGSWPFCTLETPLSCKFLLASKASKELPLGRNHLNATISFDGEGCGATKAEFNINNPSWYDIADVSLVDGYSNKVSIDVAGEAKLGPPVGRSGNEKVYGLFPYGCDVCTARQSPPCGISPGGSGCKYGTQYKPDIPCQHQGKIKQGGERYRVTLE